MGKFRKAISIVVIVLLILSLSAIVFAEFTRASFVKRIVAAYEPLGLSFSSNILERKAKSYYTSRVDEAIARQIKNGEYESEYLPQENIIISNCPQDNESKTYKKQISYSLTAQFVNYNDEAIASGEYRARIYTDNDTYIDVSIGSETLIGEFTLPAGDEDGSPASKHYFRLMLSPNLLNKDVFLKIKATPTVQYSDINSETFLISYINVAEILTSVSTGWTLSQTDVMSQTPSDSNYYENYYGYNYRLSGTGDGWVTIKWDSTKLRLSELFPDQVYDAIIMDAAESAYNAVIQTAWQNAYDAYLIEHEGDEIGAKAAGEAAAKLQVTIDAANAAKTVELEEEHADAVIAKEITVAGDICSMTIPVNSYLRSSYELQFYPVFDNEGNKVALSFNAMKPGFRGTPSSICYITYDYPIESPLSDS